MLRFGTDGMGILMADDDGWLLLRVLGTGFAFILLALKLPVLVMFGVMAAMGFAIGFVLRCISTIRRIFK